MPAAKPARRHAAPVLRHLAHAPQVFEEYARQTMWGLPGFLDRQTMDDPEHGDRVWATRGTARGQRVYAAQIDADVRAATGGFPAEAFA